MYTFRIKIEHIANKSKFCCKQISTFRYLAAFCQLKLPYFILFLSLSSISPEQSSQQYLTFYCKLVMPTDCYLKISIILFYKSYLFVLQIFLVQSTKQESLLSRISVILPFWNVEVVIYPILAFLDSKLASVINGIDSLALSPSLAAWCSEHFSQHLLHVLCVSTLSLLIFAFALFIKT